MSKVNLPGSRRRGRPPKDDEQSERPKYEFKVPQVVGYVPMFPQHPERDLINEDYGLPQWIVDYGLSGSRRYNLSRVEFRKIVQKAPWLCQWIEECFNLGMSTIEVSRLLGIPAFMWHVDDYITATTTQRYLSDPKELEWDRWLRSLFDRSQAVYHSELRRRCMTADNTDFARLFPMLQKTLFDIDINDAASRRVAVPVMDQESVRTKAHVAPKAALPTSQVEDAVYDFDPDKLLSTQDVADAEREQAKKDDLKDLRPPTTTRH